MLSEQAVSWLRDIVEACDRIRRWTASSGGAEAAVLGNDQTRSAIERQILIISEAAHRLSHQTPDISSMSAPEIDWAGVRGIGNFLRHRYDEIDSRMIIAVIENRLGELRSACVRVMEDVGEPGR